jgi:hypothetical protein
MDLETVRLLAGHVDTHESTVALVIHEIAEALAVQPTLDLPSFRAEIRLRAAREPDAAPCLDKLLEELEELRTH